MINLAITQRVDVVNDETRDSIDHSWFKLINDFGYSLYTIPNLHRDVKSFFVDLNIRGVILSGGNDLSVLNYKNSNSISFIRDKIEIKILNYCKAKKIPILGICRGLQILCYFFNKKIHFQESNKHVKKTHKVIFKKFFLNSLSINLPDTLLVNSYHKYLISSKEIPNELQILCQDSEGFVEGIFHKTLPWAGIMWHPERDMTKNKFTKQLIKLLFKK